VVELANLGVSVRLTLHWQNRDYWVLVRQRRQDRGDVVLKLISGYVPAHELNLPLHTAIQEVAEECLLETPEGWLGGRFNDTWLPAPMPPPCTTAKPALRAAPRVRRRPPGALRQPDAAGAATGLCAPADGLAAADL
jgi:hypothetical protein